MRIELTSTLSSAQRDSWDGLLKAAERAHPEQDASFAGAHRAEGRAVVFAMGWRDESLVALALIALTPHPFLPGTYADAMSYSGPVADSQDDLVDFLEALRRQPSFRRIGRLRITPYWRDADARALREALERRDWRAYEPDGLRETGLVDLTGSPEEIFQRFVKSARYEYRKAEKQGLQIEPVLTEDRAVAFYESLDRHRNERGMGSLSRPGFMAAFQDVYRHRRLGALTLVTHDGEIVGGWLGHCGGRSGHLMQVITEPAKLKQLNNLRVSPYLCLDAMLWAKAQGAEWLDVEGFRPNMTETDRLYRVYRYKAEFSPVHSQRLPGHALVLNRALHLTGNARDLARQTVRALRARMRRPGMVAADSAAG